MTVDLSDRHRYETDGGIAPIGMIYATMILAVGTTLVALLMALCYSWNFYLILLLPALAGLMIAGFTFLWTKLSHCRNPWLSATLGAGMGFLAYVLHFYFCLCFELRFQALPTLDQVPRYIEFRLRNDVQEDVGRPNFGAARNPSVVANSFLAVGELLFIMIIPMTAGWTRAKRAYSLDSSKWFDMERVQLPPYSGPALVEALEMESTAQTVRQYQAGPMAPMCCELMIEYQKDDKGGLSCEPVYLTIKDHQQNLAWYKPKQFKKKLLSQVELTVPEIAAFAPLFTKLPDVLKKSQEEFAPFLNAIPEVKGPKSKRTVSDVATVTPVAEPYRQRVRTNAYPWMVNLHDIIPVGFLFGGLGVIGLGAYLADQKNIAAGVAVIVLGALAIVWGIYTAGFCMSVYGVRWILRRLRKELSLRPEPSVQVNDPDNRFVSIIPRDSFTKVKLVFSSDVGLLKIDTAKRSLLLEGDIDNYVIPAGSIESCGPQCFFAPFDHAKSTELWVVQLMVQFSDGVRELLLTPGQTSFRPITNNVRRVSVTEFSQQINALR